MDLGKIKYCLHIVDDESISYSEIAEIESAFKELVESGVELRDLPENASARDMLEELEEHASEVERVIYAWFEENVGEQPWASDPSWSSRELAKEINKIQVIHGAEDSSLGVLLGETYES